MFKRSKEQEKKGSEKREDLLVSFLKVARFVFAIIVEMNVNVWFYGGCYDDAQTAQLIYDADLCVSPGNVGLTAMHSMVFGTPVLTHSNFANQMPEFEAIQQGITGDFFQEGDIIDLVNSISNWFKNHSNRELVRIECYKEIDSKWTPEYQNKILKHNLKL